MRFVVVTSRGMWVFHSFTESIDFAKAISKLDDIPFVIENSKLTKAIIEGE